MSTLLFSLLLLSLSSRLASDSEAPPVARVPSASQRLPEPKAPPLETLEPATVLTRISPFEDLPRNTRDD